MILLFYQNHKSGLRCCNENQKVPSSNPTTCLAGLGAQPHYKAPGDLCVKIVENAVINIRLVRLFHWEWLKAGRGTAKQKLKKKEKRKKGLELVSSLQTRHKNHLEVFLITCTDI